MTKFQPIFHKAYLGEWKSNLFKWRTTPSLKGRHWQDFKIFYSRTTQIISTKFGTKHPLQYVWSLKLVFFFWCSRPPPKFSLIWILHHYRRRALHFHLYLAIMAITQLGFLSVYIRPLLRLGHSFIMVNSKKTMKLTAITDRVVVELSVLKSVAEWYFFSCVYG